MRRASLGIAESLPWEPQRAERASNNHMKAVHHTALVWGVATLATMITMSSCTSDTASMRTTSTRGGGGVVSGVVSAGPTCPVERANQPCPPRPVRGEIDAQTQGGHQIAANRSDRAGRYSFRLRVGKYVLVVRTTGFPRCPPIPVAVATRMRVTVDIHCDTGIR
jgi:hypothetical protein